MQAHLGRREAIKAHDAMPAVEDWRRGRSGALRHDERGATAPRQAAYFDRAEGVAVVARRCRRRGLVPASGKCCGVAASVVLRVILVFRFPRRVGGRPGDDEDSGESGAAAVQEGDKLVKCGLFEVAVQNGRTDDGGEVKHDELCGDDDLGIMQMSDSAPASFSRGIYLTVETHESAVEVSYLPYACADENLRSP